MLNIAEIKNGIVIDHIKAGQGIRVFNWLGLDRTTDTVAFLINASSTRMGRKDIIKIDNTIDVNLDVLGMIDPNITVIFIEDGIVRDKVRIYLPKRVENILHCKNPRCITSTELSIPHVFHLENSTLRTYRCEYCDELRSTEELQ